jgi:hypothetical protein
MPNPLNKNDTTILPVTACFECPLSYAEQRETWCSHPLGPKPPVRKLALSPECPLKEAPAIVMLKKDADALEEMLRRLGKKIEYVLAQQDTPKTGQDKTRQDNG